ncbi:hypothetical protein [Bosea sp. 685]|uniref:hypothetical protein n=1 Tax=Bosea sp. 685 TaxID=3080057 RepID=UPI0028929D67|nr:hypothetical protein [Bosea sp. 685]WNJ89167.1 hypothetical protein RMR04_22515 [Bosea sp. 685]
MPELDPFTRISTAIEDRLRLAFKANRWDFHIVPDPLSDAEFRSLVTRTPLLALSFRQMNPPDKGVGRRFSGNLGMRLTIVVKNPNGRQYRYLGDAKGPGLFPSMSGAALLLNGFTVADLGTIFVGAIAQAYAEGFPDLNAAIATIDLTMLATFGDILGDFENADDFLSTLSSFEPWPDPELQPRDEPYDVRTP